MTEKRFTMSILRCKDTGVRDNNNIMNTDEVCNLLNELHEENQLYKALLHDRGLLMSDEDVMCIRTEIADKFIKPICKENGFDVDVDCTNGITIIPKR